MKMENKDINAAQTLMKIKGVVEMEREPKMVMIPNQLVCKCGKTQEDMFGVSKMKSFAGWRCPDCLRKVHFQPMKCDIKGCNLKHD